MLFHLLRRSAAFAIAALVLMPATPVSAQKAGQVLTFFSNTNAEASPRGNVVFDSAGVLYGVSAGFCVSGPPCGEIWKLTPGSGGQWTKSVVHTFGYQGGLDGSNPEAGLIADSAGNLYGTANIGGDLNCSGAPPVGCGTVYKLSPKGDGTFTFSLLYVFQGDLGIAPGGSFPAASLTLDSAGNLYGTTTRGGPGELCGGPGCGVVFKLTPNPKGLWTETVLHNFKGGAEGSYLAGRLIFDSAGNLYGTTMFGGNGSTGCTDGCGVVFKLTPNPNGEWPETVLFSFKDAGQPRAGVVVDSAGNLYGTTESGGPNFVGTVFKIDPNGNETDLHQFTGSPDGAMPEAELFLDPNGNLYGTTYAGGKSGNCQNGCGTAFKLTPTSQGWKEQTVSFNVNNGALPRGGLTPDSAGNFYGCTTAGGQTRSQDGAAYEIFRP